MELSKSSLWLKAYNLYIPDKMPSNICNLFWGSVIGVITLILSLPYYLFSKIGGKIGICDDKGLNFNILN